MEYSIILEGLQWKDVFIYFIDYQKALDKKWHDQLMILQETRINKKDIQIIHVYCKSSKFKYIANGTRQQSSN